MKTKIHCTKYEHVTVYSFLETGTYIRIAIQHTPKHHYSRSNITVGKISGNKDDNASAWFPMDQLVHDALKEFVEHTIIDPIEKLKNVYRILVEDNHWFASILWTALYEHQN